MSNSNTRRRKQKKQQRGIQQGLAFAGLRRTGKSRTPAFIVISNPPSPGSNWTKVWIDETTSIQKDFRKE